MRSFRAAICLAIAFSFCAAGGAFALSAKNVPLPRPKPEPPKREILSERDVRLLKDVFDDIRRHQWDDARRKARQAREPLARKLIDWMYYREHGNGASFREISAFLEENSDWPSTGVLQYRAEERMPPGLPPDRVIAWFKDREPRTGKGRWRLGEALIAKGNYKDGREMIREAWVHGDFSRSEESEFLGVHSDLLRNSDADERRLDRLLWDHRHTAARRQMKRVGAGWRRLAEARMKLRAMSRGVDRAISRVPAKLSKHPGLQYERARWRRRKGRHEETWPILSGVHKTAQDLGDAERWWKERRLQIRRALREGRKQTAYDMAAHHGLSEGVYFAEAEWLAGWIALRFLQKPKDAFGHFKRLETKVSTPISQARAHYWAGRAAEAMGENEARQHHYREAVRYLMTFYGQLAAERLYGENAYLQLPAEAPRNPADAADFEKRELIRALKILHDAEQERWVRSLTYHLADEYSSPEEIFRLSSLLKRMGYPHFAVRAGKSALHRGMMLVEATYPLERFEPVKSLKSAPEPAIVLGLSRQESEFHPGAVSHAGAHGLMQLIPTTARATARKHGLPFRRDWLTERPAYNLTLGQAHFADLVEDFNGSYIMAAAAYNAGKTRVRRWIREFGDPRAKNVDAVDWIEMIPYSETRNYVQRVMENTLVYRTLLADQPVQIVLSQDLKRGGGPDPKPRKRKGPAIAPPPKQQAVSKVIEQARPPRPEADVSPGKVGGDAGVLEQAPGEEPAEPVRPPAQVAAVPLKAPGGEENSEAAAAAAAASAAIAGAGGPAEEAVNPVDVPFLAASWPRRLFQVSAPGAEDAAARNAGAAGAVATVSPQPSTPAEITAAPANGKPPALLVEEAADDWPIPSGCKRYVVKDDGPGVCAEQ